MWVSAENRLETLVWILISSTSKDVGNTECFWTKEPVPLKTEHSRTKTHTERHEREKRTSRKHYYYKINIKSQLKDFTVETQLKDLDNHQSIFNKCIDKK